MTDFQGFDLYADPGDAALADAKAQGFSWVASYLPAPSHSDDSWRDYPTLHASGLNVTPVWVGAQSEGPGSHDLGATQGAQEATDCLARMDALKYPLNIGVAFDTENGSPLTEAQTAHLTAWRDGIKAGYRRPLAYGSYLNFDALAAIFGPGNVWVFMLRDQPPDYQGMACQWKQSTVITLAGKPYTVDLDVSKDAAPAGFEPPAPKPVPEPVVTTIPADPPVVAPVQDTSGGITFSGSGGGGYERAPQVTITPGTSFTIPIGSKPMPAIPSPTPVRTAVSKSGPPIAAGATATAILGAAAASGVSVNFHQFIDQTWPLLASGMVLPLIMWLAGRALTYLHIQTQSALADEIRTVVANGASFALSEAQSYADSNATINVKSAQQAAAMQYVAQAIPQKLAAAGVTQQQLANLVTAQLAKVPQ